jgi:2-succinyl-6-hydroxy-2,4-cyclohexadiene-1-carboxylate synthase
MAEHPPPLACRTTGPTGAPRLVAVHGFTQTGTCWGPVIDDLKVDHNVVLVDAPGHGQSAALGHLDLVAGATALGATGGRATYLGYSMGGRLALRLALDRPDLVDRLVVIGAHPGIDDTDERAARRRHDNMLASRLEALGVDAFLDDWLGLELFAGLAPESRHVAERRTNTVAGLAGSLRNVGTGTQTPLWGRLGELAEHGVPSLWVTGALDQKFDAIAARATQIIGPSATHARIPGAGHSVHLERPAAFTAVLRAWLRLSTLPK